MRGFTQLKRFINGLRSSMNSEISYFFANFTEPLFATLLLKKVCLIYNFKKGNAKIRCERTNSIKVIFGGGATLL